MKLFRPLAAARSAAPECPTCGQLLTGLRSVVDQAVREVVLTGACPAGHEARLTRPLPAPAAGRPPAPEPRP